MNRRREGCKNKEVRVRKREREREYLTVVYLVYFLNNSLGYYTIAMKLTEIIRLMLIGVHTKYAYYRVKIMLANLFFAIKKLVIGLGLIPKQIVYACSIKTYCQQIS